MTAKPTRVEINGRIYDAKTGELMSIKHSKKSVIGRQKVIDGFVKPSAVHSVINTSALPKKPRKIAPKASGLHAAQQPTRRLHPAVSGIHRSTSSITRHKRSTHDIQRRREMARDVKKSQLINKHRAKVKDTIVVDKPRLHEKITAPLPFMAKKMPKATKPSENRVKKPSITEESIDLSWFKRHLIPAAASFSVLVLLGGFMIYNSLPNLTMRVAASRAGFNASVPNYQPSGFTFGGPVSYGPGRVVIKFNSNTDEREFTITEKRSGWDSRSLLDNFVKTEAENYIPFEGNGLTVYLYNDSQATWVDEGIWYTVGGSANLSSEQLLKIAASL